MEVITFHPPRLTVVAVYLFSSASLADSAKYGALMPTYLFLRGLILANTSTFLTSMACLRVILPSLNQDVDYVLLPPEQRRAIKVWACKGE